jgi:subtilisin family serine protease
MRGMVQRRWSRRDVLKSVGAGAVAAGVGAGVAAWMNEYIVGAKRTDGVTAAAAVSDSEHARIDLTNHGDLTLVCGVYSEGREESLRSRDDVAFVQRDRRLTYVSGTNMRSTADASSARAQTLPWGIDRVDADVAHAEGSTGDGVHVGVIDGGIAASHPDLEGNLADPSTDGNHESWVDCEGGDCEYPWSDDGGHGTHVAGTIAADGSDGVVGVAPDATLHALKVCGANGGCRTSAIVEAIRHAADQGWDVVNLSLGSPSESPALQAAGQYALDAGVLPVAAAGNRGEPDSVGYPASYEEFLAVAATTIDDESASFSSIGPEVDVAAPGASVCSAGIDGYQVLDGTSMASPHVAGAAAQAIADGATLTEIRGQLEDAAEDIGLADTEQGAGLVDVAAALGYDSSDDGTGDGTSCPS